MAYFVGSDIGGCGIAGHSVIINVHREWLHNGLCIGTCLGYRRYINMQIVLGHKWHIFGKALLIEVDRTCFILFKCLVFSGACVVVSVENKVIIIRDSAVIDVVIGASHHIAQAGRAFVESSGNAGTSSRQSRFVHKNIVTHFHRVAVVVNGKSRRMMAEVGGLKLDENAVVIYPRQAISSHADAACRAISADCRCRCSNARNHVVVDVSLDGGTQHHDTIGCIAAASRSRYIMDFIAIDMIDRFSGAYINPINTCGSTGQVFNCIS